MWFHWRTLGILYVNTQKLNLAVDAFQQAVQVGENSPQAHNDLARLYAGLNRSLVQAVQLAKKAVFLSNDAQYLDTLSYVYYRNGDYSKALQAAQSAIRLAPDNRQYQAQLQQIKISLSEPE